MPDKVMISDRITSAMIRARAIDESLDIKGRYLGLHYRAGKLIGEYPVSNLVVNQGKNKLWDVMFNGSAQIAAASWCMGLISSTGYSAIVVADTIASHGGWTEFTGYSQSTRVAWGPGASSAQTVTNATPAQFDFNATGTVKGIFIVSQNTKGGTTGTLWSEGLFSSDVPVVADDQIKLTYAASI